MTIPAPATAGVPPAEPGAVVPDSAVGTPAAPPGAINAVDWILFTPDIELPPDIPGENDDAELPIVDDCCEPGTIPLGGAIMLRPFVVLGIPVPA